MSDFPIRYSTVPVDLKGHTSNERFFTGEDGVVRMKFVDWGILPPEEEMWIDIEHGFSKSCSKCDGYMGLRYDPKTQTGFVTLEPCTVPKRITTRTEVEFPSGKILVADSIPGNWLKAADLKTSASYNSGLGQSQAIIYYAVRGTAFGPTGNEGLGLYKVADDHYQIISPGYDEDTDAEISHGLCVAGICTDLWAYSIVDYQKWLDAGNEETELGWTETVVSITPGRYRFTYYGRPLEDTGEMHVYCDMELI